MLQPDFDPAPKTLRIHRCGYVSKCKKVRCRERARGLEISDRRNE